MDYNLQQLLQILVNFLFYFYSVLKHVPLQSPPQYKVLAQILEKNVKMYN